MRRPKKTHLGAPPEEPQMWNTEFYRSHCQCVIRERKRITRDTRAVTCELCRATPEFEALAREQELELRRAGQMGREADAR